MYSTHVPRDKQQDINVKALADAVAEALAKMGLSGGFQAKDKDDFDDGNTLQKMAELMTRPASKDSNLEQAGHIETHKKDVSGTLDLLNQMDKEK